MRIALTGVAPGDWFTLVWDNTVLTASGGSVGLASLRPSASGGPDLSTICGMPAATPFRPRREAKAVRAERAAEVVRRLVERYPAPQTALDHRSAWELLVATILSAQSTDETVNKVTPELFRRWPTPEALAGADRDELERLIYPTGFFRNKSRSILGAAQAILERYGGEVPDNLDELVALPGVGRKTANVVLGSFFGIESGVVVDTHVGRLTRRLGLTRHIDPVKAEQDLMAIVPRDQWTSFSHRLIFLGREICTAKDPRCDQCPLADICPSAFKVGRFVPKPSKPKRRAPARSRPPTAR
jgi:endonuclease III